MTATTLHGRFLAVAGRAPHRVALTDEAGPVTYGELAAQAGRVALLVQQAATGDDPLVALEVGRGRAAVAAMLGVLAAGRAYVPIDPDYPAARRAFLRRDAGARLRLTDAPEGAGQVVGREGALLLEEAGPGAARAVAPGTAYVLYTSGSTGDPKGCMVGHDNVLALFDACAPLFSIGPDDVWSCLHSFSFDFSVWELLGALLHGGTVVILPRRRLADPEALVASLAVNEVTRLSATPSLFAFLARESEVRPVRLPRLRTVVLGGEAVVPADVETWLERVDAPGAAVENMYGITETTVHVTRCRLSADLLRRCAPGRTPIGRPLPHLEVSLRAPDGERAGPGEAGEIWVAGAGVSRGYLGRPELTAERFPSAPDGRWYRSGDWAEPGEDGALAYAGRRDRQVKVRGHRIELGEIEAALRRVGGVRDAACLVAETAAGGRLVVAYLTGPAPVPGERVREALAASVPAHLVPHRFHWLDRLPTTSNGKVDHAALGALR
jgi:nonribosomal peptide synthetase DhbF